MIFPIAPIFKAIVIALIIATTFTQPLLPTPPILTTSNELAMDAVENIQSEAFDKHYDGYVCFLQKSSDDTIDVYLKANEDCALQAFDIYLDTNQNNFDVVSYTGKDITVVDGHFNLQSIANGLEMEMKANENYKIASIKLPICDNDYAVKVLRADLAIAHTPLAPSMDNKCLQLKPIIIGA